MLIRRYSPYASHCRHPHLSAAAVALTAAANLLADAVGAQVTLTSTTDTTPSITDSSLTSLSTTSSRYAYPTDPVVSCDAIGDYAPVCVAANKQMFCLRKKLIPHQVSYACDSGEVCCPSQSNQCVQAADCPSVSLPPEPPAPPAPTTTRSADPGVHWVPGGTPPKDPDNYCYFLGTGNICISSSQYAACSAYEFMGNITCPMGTVCCYKTNLCDYASSCPGQ